MNDTVTTKLNPVQKAFVDRWVAPSPDPQSDELDLGGEDHPEVESSSNMRDRGHGIALNIGPVPGKIKAKLDAPDSGMILAKDWGMVASDKSMARTAFTMDFAGSILAAKGKPNKMEKIQAVLPILDAPENNPERRDVGRLLGELEEIEKRYGELVKKAVEPEKTELAKAAAEETIGKLNEMERTLAEWLNRRTEQGLPPTQEAMAMSDLVQREHTKVIGEFVTKGWSPPPVADAGSLTDDETATVKKAWDDMISGASCIKVEVKDPTGVETDKLLYDHLKGLRGTPTPEQVQKFRTELLSNMSRLLGSPAGRDLLGALEKAGKKINFFPGTTPQAWAATANTRVGSTADVDNPQASKKSGDHTTIEYPIGRKDSDEILRTEDGNFLFSPTHVIIGHEMVHALHNSEGIHRAGITGMSTAEKNMWTDFEEVWTIKKGDLSEQTLRNDYGLSADRFGHAFPETRDELADKAIAQAEKAKKLYDLMHSSDVSIAKVDVRKVLVEDRKFGQAFYDRLTDAMKIDIYEDPACTGPLPDGWDPLRLTPEKIKGIVADKLPNRLPALGWTSYNMAYSGSNVAVFGFSQSIKEIVTHRVHHPRSTEGRRFKALGEQAVFGGLGAFRTSTGVDLGRWNDRDWRENLETLNRAAARVDMMIAKLPFLTAGSVPAAPELKDTLAVKLQRISARFASALVGQEPDKAGPYFADDALAYFKINLPTAAEQLTELKKKEGEIAPTYARLKSEGGLAVESMSLVARAKAGEALAAFEKEPALAQAKELAKKLAGLVGKEDKASEAADVYADLLGLTEQLIGQLSRISPPEVAEAIRRTVLAPLDAQILQRMDIGDLLEAATEAAEKKGHDISAGDPTIKDILSNTHLIDALGEYVEAKLESGKVFWGFRYALHQRETRKLTDLAQGNDLVKAGLRQDTVVRLRRDSGDTEARALATDEVQKVLEGARTGFLTWYRSRTA
jgi:hypothetical protein